MIHRGYNLYTGFHHGRVRFAAPLSRTEIGACSPEPFLRKRRFQDQAQTQHSGYSRYSNGKSEKALHTGPDMAYYPSMP